MAQDDKMQSMKDASTKLTSLPPKEAMLNVDEIYAEINKENDSYKERFNPYNVSGETKIRPQRYDGLNIDATLYNTREMEAIGSLDQGWGDALANTAKGFMGQSAAGFLDFFAGNYDFQGMYNMAAGNSEAKLGNWLNDIADGIRTGASEDNPIFSTGSMTEKGYWLNQIQGLGYSGGLLAGGVIDQIAMAAITGGIGNAATTGLKTARTFSMMRNAIQGVRSGMGEAYINGLHTMKEVKQKYLDKGLSEEEANEKAAEAATLGFRLEVGPLALLNSLQYVTMFGKAGSPFTKLETPGFGVSDALGSVGEKLVGSNKYAKGAFNMFTESMEEVYQDGIANYAKGEEFWQEGLIDSAIGGALGGLMLPFLAKGMTGAFNKLTGNGGPNEIETYREEFMQGAINNHAIAFEERAKANIAYLKAKETLEKEDTPANQTAYQKALSDLENSNVNTQMVSIMDAIRLDYGVNDGDAAFQNQVETMQSVYDAVKSNDIETLKSFNLVDDAGKEKFEGSFQEVLTHYPKFIKDANTIKGLVSESLENDSSDLDIAIKIAGANFKVQSFLATSDTMESGLQILKSQDPLYGRLSPEGKALLDLEIEREAYQRLGNAEKVAEINAQIKESGYNYSMNTQDSIVGSIQTKPMVNARVGAISAMEAATRESNNVAKLKSKEGIKNLVEQKFIDQVNMATSVSSMEKLLPQLEKGGATTTTINRLKDKLDKAKAAKVAANKQAEEFAKQQAEERRLKEEAEKAEGVNRTKQQQEKQAQAASQTASQVLNDVPETPTAGEVTAMMDEFDSFFSSGSQEGTYFSARSANSSNTKRRPNLPKEVKDKIINHTNNIVEEIEKALGRKATFEDFVKNHAKQTSLADAEANFDLLEYSWELSGREVGDVDSVFKAIFSKEAFLIDLFSPYLTSNPDVIENEDPSEEEDFDEDKDGRVLGTRTDGRVIFKESNVSKEDITRTDSPLAKIAYQGHGYVEQQNPISGTYYKEGIPKLNDTLILDPEYLKEGDVLTVEVLEGDALAEAPVQIWEYNDISKRLEATSVPFGSLGYEKGTPEYTNTVPMVIKDSKGNSLGYVHSPTWYNANNIQANENKSVEENIMEGARRAISIRQQVMSGNNNVVITERKLGSFFNVNTQVGDKSNITLAEASGDMMLGIATSHNTLTDHTGQEMSGKYEILNEQPFYRGAVYNVRHVSTLPNGTKQYIAFLSVPNSLERGESLNEVAANNVKGSVLAAFLLANKIQPVVLSELEAKYGMTLTKAEQIVKSISNTTGLGAITDSASLYEYLRMFIPVFNSNTDFEAAMDSKFTESGVYAVLDNNILKIYNKIEGVSPAIEGKHLAISSINLNSGSKGVTHQEALDKNLASIEEFFGETGSVLSMPATASKKQLNKGTAFTTIDSNSNVKEDSSYTDYIKGNFKTNVKSFPMTNAKGETIWVTDVQPMLYIQSSVGTQVNVPANTVSGVQAGGVSPAQSLEKLKENEKEVEVTNTSDTDTSNISNTDNTNTENTDSTEDLDLEDLDLDSLLTSSGSFGGWGDTSTQTSTQTGQPAQSQTQAETFTKVTLEDSLSNLDSTLADSIRDILPGLEGLGDMNFDSRRNFQEEGDQEILLSLLNLHTNRIEGLNQIEQVKLVDSLFNAILSESDLKNKDLDINAVSGLITNAFDKYMKEQRDKYLNIATQIENSDKIDGNLQIIVNNIKKAVAKIENVEKQKDKLLSIEGNKGALTIEFERFLSTSLKEHQESIEEDVQVSDTGEQERAYDESAFERNVQQSFSAALKVFFSGIPKINTNTGKVSKNVFGLTDYVSPQDAVQTLREAMIDQPSSIEDVIASLEIKAASSNLHKVLLEKLVSAPEKLQNEILYKLIQHQLDMYMVMYDKDTKTGMTSLKVYNANSTSPDITLIRQWRNNLTMSGLTKVEEGIRIFDITKVSEIVEKIDKLTHEVNRGIITEVTPEVVEEVDSILRSVGIILGTPTLNYFTGAGGNTAVLKDVLGGAGVIGLLKPKLYKISKTDASDVTSLNAEKANPLMDIRGALNKLADLEIDMNGSRLSKAFRVSDKVIQGAVQNMMAYELSNKIVDTKGQYFKDLKGNPLTAGNFVLEAMLEDELVAKKYGVDFVSLNAIKNKSARKEDMKKVKDLSDFDGNLAQLAFFMNTTSNINYRTKSGLTFRMSQMFNPALSDKEQMLLFNTPVVNIGFGSFNAGGKGVNDAVLEFMADQLFSSELRRIVHAHKNSSNIKGYKDASKYFIAIPGINDILITGEGGVESEAHKVIPAYIESNPDASIQELIDGLELMLREKAKQAINITIDREVQNKITFHGDGTISGSWVELGLVELEEVNGVNQLITPHFDSNYLKRISSNPEGAPFKGVTQKGKTIVTAYDYVINNLLSQNNVYQLYAGDMALYGVAARKYNVDGVYNSTQMALSIGENITKRMAMLIAPGNKLANSKGDSYIQIMMNDPVSITNTAESYITQFYGEVTEQDIKDLDAIRKIEDRESETSANFPASAKYLKKIGDKKKELIKGLQKRYPDISKYFEIEGADAQEYTTWKEHLDILLRQGRLSASDRKALNVMYEKLERGEDLTKEELVVILNPIKPVYAGPHTDRRPSGEVEVMRTMYIKSSSFPLLPQMTRDFKLDEVRKKMEAIQKKEGKNVRLAYNTATKIGSSISKLTIHDLYNKPLEELYNDDKTGMLNDSMLTLDRDNFRIQQDTPYKTERYLAKNSEDYTTMGSQIWKILMGGGIAQEGEIFPNILGPDVLKKLNSISENLYGKSLDFDFNKKLLSGAELNQIKTLAEGALLNQIKRDLYSDLKISKDGNIVDRNATMRALRDVLIQEVSTRNYSQNMIDSLELVEDIIGEAEFVTPMWMAANANKFESLIQSIITSRMIQLKLPGNQLISASSEGFEKRTLQELDSNTRQGIVWFDPEHSGALKATRYENGKLKEAEVLVQSKFRHTYKDKDGKEITKLIDLTSPKYSYKKDGFTYLKLDMIDAELLTNFSFRIPTSSHQSAAIIKVVGFLPESSGDMLVVPGEQTIQLGEDYDIDKRTVYRSHYNLDDKGAIRKLGAFAPKDANLREKKEHNKKVFENVMIDMYKAVYLTNNVHVQNKISQALSFDNAADTSKSIEKRIKGQTDYTGFTLLSDDFQRAQMKLGADGKIGIGAHSNSVTLQSMLERLGEGEVTIMEPIEVEDGQVDYIPSIITIGTLNGKPLSSDGKLGRLRTLDDGRYIADILTENQNSSTDNIKEQIMGRRNENPYTMNVLIQLNMRGFDMVPVSNVPGHTEIQISSLFIAQPIIRKYVEKMSETQSILSGYDPNAEEKIIKEILEEFGENFIEVTRGPSGQVEIDLDDYTYERKSLNMTGDVLYDNLIEETADPKLQVAVLKTFLKLRAEAGQVNKVQKLLNLHSTGLGVSYFNVLRRSQTFKEIIYGEVPIVNGAHKLISQGDVKTSEGQMLIEALEVANTIMPIVFPYNDSGLRTVREEILLNVGRDHLSEKGEEELNYKIMSNFKKFTQSQDLGLYLGTPNAERGRLFFDTKDNTSLASMMLKMSISTDPAIHALFKTNPLLRGFNYRGISNSVSPMGGYTPSILTQVPDQNDEYGRADKYTAFLELLQDDLTNLGEYNGEVMTPRKLAQDLASYAFLAEDNQATGFLEYINVDYLKLIGVTDRIRQVSNNISSSDIPTFTRQFFQHNPNEAYQVNETDIATIKKVEGASNLNTLRYFHKDALPDDSYLKMSGKKYISVETGAYNEKTKSKIVALFELNEFNMYTRISTLGYPGYTEYSPGIPFQSSMTSSVNTKANMEETSRLGAGVSKSSNENSTPQLTPGEESFLTRFGANPSVESILLSIARNPNSKYVNLAFEISKHIRDGVKVEIFDRGDKPHLGKYDANSNTIYIASDILQAVSDLKLDKGETVEHVIEEILMEEIIHSTTVDILSKYGDPSSKEYNPVGNDIPIFITKLATLFEEAKKSIPDSHYTSSMAEFVAGALTVNSFKEELSKIKMSEQSHDTMLDRFRKIVGNVVRYITGSKFDSAVVQESLNLIRYRGVTKTGTKINSSLSSINQEQLDIFYNQDFQKKLEEALAYSNGDNSRPLLPSQAAKQGKPLIIANAKAYNAESSARFLAGFKAGSPVITSNAANIESSVNEMAYINDMFEFLQGISPENSDINSNIKVETNSSGQIKITPTKVMYDNILAKGVEFATSQVNEAVLKETILTFDDSYENFLNELNDSGIINKNC